MNDDLAQMLKDTGKAVPVPGKPGRVYVFSKKKGVVVETSAKRAASWQAIGAAGRAARQTLSEAAEESYQSQAKENPMGRRREYDDSYFFEQYSQDPYGAQQAIPAARRNPEMDENPGRRRKKRQASPLAIAAFKRAQAIMKSKGCSIADALKQAWAEIPRTAKAAANPYFDSTQTRSALVPASFEWSDPTMTVTALEPMGRSNPDLTESDYWGGNARKKGAFAQRLGQFSPVQTSGFQPVNRRNPEGEVLYTSKGQPYVIEIVDGKRRARFIKKNARSNPYFDPTQTRSALVPADFQWSDSTMTVTSLEPMGRMNPGRASRVAAGLSARAEKAAAAGRTVQAARVQKAADRLANWADRHRGFKTPALAPDDFYSPFAGASGVTLKGSTTPDGSSSSFFPHQGSAVYESGSSSPEGFDPELVPAASQGRAVFAPGLRYDRDSGYAPDAAESVTDSEFWGGSNGRMGALNYRLGQFSTSETSGFQPVNRRNPRRKK